MLSRRTFLSTTALTATAVAALTACDAHVEGAADGAAAASGTDDFYDGSLVHTLAVSYDDADYQAMLVTYADSGDKEWISATAVIDGTTYDNVGLKLKGNSSLQGLANAITGSSDEAGGQGPGGMGSELSPDEPQGLPWRIKLDEYVDGQQTAAGESDFVVRGSSSATGLNEAVALAMLGESGQPTQLAAAVRFSVNGGDERLRLVVQNPDDQHWYTTNVDDDGVFFKAESGGDYSYRGTDYADYTEAFDLQGNPEDLSDEDAYAPLIAFLEFINDSSDDEFADQLGDRLEVERFAQYLAFEDLVGNTDDIDGPGNNAYLAYDPDTGRVTVVAWDHNLALGSGMGGIGGGGQLPGGGGGEMPTEGEGAPSGGDMQPPGEGERPSGGAGGGGAQGGGMASQDNPLVQRFEANETFAAMTSDARTRLQTDLVASGYAADVLARWTSVLTEQAGDLVDTGTIQSESDVVAAQLASTGTA